MAQRQSLDGEILELRPDQFLFNMRMLNRIEVAAAAAVAAASLAALTQLGLSRDMTKARAVAFDGALNVDTASLLDWFNKIAKRPDCKNAVGQLVELDAAAALRAGLT